MDPIGPGGSIAVYERWPRPRATLEIERAPEDVRTSHRPIRVESCSESLRSQRFERVPYAAMDGSFLGAQFCFELAFGVLFALGFVPRAPVGVLFYRMMGTTALISIAGGIFLLVRREAAAETALSAPVIAAGLSVLAWPFYSAQARGPRWRVGLFVGLGGCAAGLFMLLAENDPEASVAAVSLATLSTLATGAVAGSVGLAMVLGHWYLTVPKLEVRHLRRLNLVTIASMVASLVFLGITLVAFRDTLITEDTTLFGPWGLFHLGTRVAVGLLLPLVFAWMAHDSLRFENTRSATGILYASTVLVLIGTAVSISLQSSYGVPL